MYAAKIRKNKKMALSKNGNEIRIDGYRSLRRTDVDEYIVGLYNLIG